MTRDEVAKRLGEELTERKLWRWDLALDLDDPATAGVLLSLLHQEMDGESTVETLGHREVACVTLWLEGVSDGRSFDCSTLGEACGRALLALWEAE